MRSRPRPEAFTHPTHASHSSPPRRAAFVTLLLLALGQGCANLDAGDAAGGADASDGGSGQLTGCQSDGAGWDTGAPAVSNPQFAVSDRDPPLGARVCNGVVHRWQHENRGSPVFVWGFGARHTAGPFPVGALLKTTADKVHFVVKEPFNWAGPGNHVHLVAKSQATGELVLDPFFEYELLPAP